MITPQNNDPLINDLLEEWTRVMGEYQKKFGDMPPWEFIERSDTQTEINKMREAISTGRGITA